MIENKIIEKYIEEQSEYIFNKYIYSKFLMTKYYKNFGKLEVEKIKKAYDLFTLDKKMEYRFVSEAIGERLNESFAQAEAAYEYKDAMKQIRRLNVRNKFSEKNFDILSDAINNDIKSKIKEIIKNMDPILNAHMDTSYEYNKFIEDMKSTKFDNIEHYLNRADFYGRNNIINFVARVEDKELEKLIKRIASKNKKMRSDFPFTFEEVLMSQEKIDFKKEELKKQIDTTNKAFDRLNHYYIMTKDEGNWTS